MEPEGSLPYSQVLATCPYHEPARSSPLLAHSCHYYPLALRRSNLDGSRNGTAVTDRALLIQCSAKKTCWPTARRVLSITAFCIRIFRAGRRLSSFKLSCIICCGVSLWIELVVLYTKGPCQLLKECHPRCVYQNYNGLIINNGSQKHSYIYKYNNSPTTCFGLIRSSSGWKYSVRGNKIICLI